jgi:hypothetical protein
MLAPTRELAIQVYESVKTYSRYVPIRSCCVFGGVDIKPQIAEIRCGVEVLVATPGRLLDLFEQKCLNFASVQALVLDEADRMLDMGFVPDVTRIINLLPRQRQSLLFSATFSEEIKKLADGMLKSPVLVEVAKRNTVSETITHRVHPVAAEAKRALLIKLLKSADFNQVLVFTRTKIETNRLARELQRAGIAADSIHGDKSQQDRLKALEASRRVRSWCWLPPTSPRAASTLTNCRTSSTLNCHARQRTTSTVSAVRVVRANRERPFHWSRPVSSVSGRDREADPDSGRAGSGGRLRTRIRLYLPTRQQTQPSPTTLATAAGSRPPDGPAQRAHDGPQCPARRRNPCQQRASLTDCCRWFRLQQTLRESCAARGGSRQRRRPSAAP